MPTSWSNRSQPSTSWTSREEVGDGSLLLEDGSSYLLQEDNDSKFILGELQWTVRTQP